MQILIWAEHTVLAGRVCHDEDKAGSDDVVAYEGSEEELRASALAMRERAKTARAGHDLHLIRSATAIQEAIGDEDVPALWGPKPAQPEE